MGININTKTSTDKLVTKKDVKRHRTETVFKEMEDIIGFERFMDLGMNGNEYCAIMKCRVGYSILLKLSTVDFQVLSEDDQTNFENKLISFCFGLDFPAKLIRCNRKQEFGKYIEFLEKVTKRTTYENDLLTKYKEDLVEEFKRMEKSNRSTIRTNYIVVYSNNPNDATAYQEVQSNANYILKSLKSKDFKTSIVSNFELFNFMYFNFHRGLDIDLETFFEKDAFNLVVSGLGDKLKPSHLTDEMIELKINEEEERKKNEEIELQEKMKPKEFKKYIKEQKKKELAESKANKQYLEKNNLVNTAFIDILKPDIFLAEQDYIRLGTDLYVRMIALNTLPQGINMSTLNDLNTMEDVEMHISLEPQNSVKAVKAIKGELSKIMSNIYMEEKKTGMREHGQRKQADNMEGLVALLETNEDKLFNSQILLKVYASSLLELEEKTRRLKEMYAKEAIDLKVLFLDQRKAFVNTMPSADVRYRGNFQPLLTGGAATMIPTGNSHLRHSEGIYIGTNVLTNSPIIIDKFMCQKKKLAESANYSNPNIYICGIPGSGKSTFIKLNISRSMLLGDLNIGIDPHGEYPATCKTLNGKYVKLQSGTKSGINPLDLRVIIDDDGNKVIPISIKANELTNMINNFVASNRRGQGLIGLELSNVSKACMNVYERFGITKDENSIYEFYEENGEKKKRRKVFPTLSDLKHEIEILNDILKEESSDGRDLKEVLDLMSMITGNGTMNIFDCQTDRKIEKLLDNKLVIFGLKELDETTRKYAMTTMLNWLWSVFSDYNLLEKQKNVLVDEAWILADQEEALAMLNNCARSGRKFLISLIIATQSLIEFQSSPKGKAILDFCSYKFIFKQEARLAKETGEYFNLSNSVVAAMPSFSKGQCALVSEVTSMIAQVGMFNFEEKFATT